MICSLNHKLAVEVLTDLISVSARIPAHKIKYMFIYS